MTATGPFSRLRSTSTTAVRRIAATILIVIVAAFEICRLTGLRINASPSLPVGLYLVTSNPSANLVEFCPVGPLAQVAMTRGYRDEGSCPDGGAPFLKPVIARTGDIVEVSKRGLAVDGHLLPNTAPLQCDTRNRLLTAWPSGRYTVAADRVWVASSYNPRSFDSRYFGPLPTSAIRAHVRPIFTAW